MASTTSNPAAGAPCAYGEGTLPPDIYPDNLAHNARQIDFLRSTSLSLAGSTAGVLGLRNLAGFYFYAALLVGVNAVLLGYCARGAPGLYIVSLVQGQGQGYAPGREEGARKGGLGGRVGKLASLLVQGATENLFSFVLWWTMWYGIVHVYD